MKKLLLIAALLIGSSLYAGPSDSTPQTVGPFGTLNNRDSSYTLPADKAQDLLNVEITQGGKSVKKRSGYATAFTLNNATSAVHGTYIFYDSNGNDVSLFFNDTRLNVSVNGGTPSVMFSTGPLAATYQCTDNLGFAYCANSARSALYKINATTSVFVTGFTSTGTMVAATPTRLAMAGFSDSPSRIDLCSETDFNNWTTGSLGTSGVQITVQSPGARITHIVYAFGRLMWFKDTSFGYILIGNQPLQTDWVVKTVSYDVGTNDNMSVYREGILYFRGKDSHIYAFDGSNYTRLTKEISATINESQVRASNSWTQTSQSDWQAGASDPQGWISTTVFAGSVSLDTAAAISPLVDTSAADFNLGTLTNLDSVTQSGRLSISLGSVFVSTQQYDTGAGDYNTCVTAGGGWVASRVYAVRSIVVSSVTLRLKINGTAPSGSSTVSIANDSGGTIGSEIASGSFSPSSLAGSYGDILVGLSNARIVSGATYYIKIVPSSDCDNSGSPKRVYWETQSYGNGAAGGGLFNNGSATFESGAYNKWKVHGSTFLPSGDIVSRAFDVGFSTNTWLWGWQNFSVTSQTPSNTTLTYETQTSSSATGTFTSLVAATSGTAPTSTVQQFIRYKASFATTDSSTSPVLNDATISMSSRLRPGATFYSAIKTASALTSWDTFTADKQDNGGTHTFSIRASSNTFSITSATPTWGIVGIGAVPTVSTASFFQIADRIIAATTDSPKMDAFTQNWFEGNAADKAYATYFDDKIMWAVTSGAGATTNNKLLILDMLNQGWLIWDVPSNGFTVRQNRLYFGSPTSGVINKYGDTDSDNGSAINAYWKSKDFFGDSPFTDKEYTYLSIVTGSVASSSMTVTYTLNGSSSTSLTVPLYTPNSSFSKRNRNLPLGKIGNTFNVQFGNNAADQPFELFGVEYGIRPKPWAVTNP